MINWLSSGCSVMINGAEVATIRGFECLFRIILRSGISFAGILVFVMFLIGGFKYLTAGGDREKTAAAGKTITYAIMGLVLMILGWFIFVFISEFSGINVTVFNIIPQP